MPTSTTIHLSAADAWQSLKCEGGLEPTGRDGELVEAIRRMLDPQAPDLATALSGASTDQFIQCFFHSIQPFTEMFRDILAYYKQAGASQGRHQFNIAIEEQHLDLRDFERFVQLWNNVPGDIDVPAVDRDAMGAHWDAWKTVTSLDDKAHGAARDIVSIGDPGVDAWLSDYRAGRLRPVPHSLWLAQRDRGFRELAAIGLAAQETILESTSSRAELRDKVQWAKLTETEPFSLDNLGFLDSDHWLGVMVAGLALANHLEAAQREKVANVLVATLSHLPTCKFRARVSFGDLLKFLSLPVWKKRHELYAVWVFTEILKAAGDHDIQLHHDDGRIAFEFRETLLASVDSALPNVDIFTEKRSPLAKPVGKGRKNNVQPDYSVWERRRSETGKCTLVVEVKHYKQSNNRSFAEVLTDYASAHPDAQVVLVNYGPIGNVVDRLLPGIKKRCSVVDNLNPLVSSQRQLFRQIVKRTLGEPHRAAMAIGGGAHATTALAVDVSRSMYGQLTNPSFRSVIDALAVGSTACEIYPIDDRLHEPVPVSQAATQLVRLARGVNALSEPVAQLLNIYEEVQVITDSGGLDDLHEFGGAIESLPEIGAIKVTVRR